MCSGCQNRPSPSTMKPTDLLWMFFGHKLNVVGRFTGQVTNVALNMIDRVQTEQAIRAGDKEMAESERKKRSDQVE